jgi:hypothetical protein
LGSSHHNIAMDGALNRALLDPRLLRVGQSRLPAPAGNTGTAAGASPRGLSCPGSWKLASPATGRFRLIALGLPEQLRQPRHVDGDPPRLVFVSTFACRASFSLSRCHRRRRLRAGKYGLHLTGVTVSGGVLRCHVCRLVARRWPAASRCVPAPPPLPGTPSTRVTPARST